MLAKEYADPVGEKIDRTKRKIDYYVTDNTGEYDIKLPYNNFLASVATMDFKISGPEGYSLHKNTEDYMTVYQAVIIDTKRDEVLESRIILAEDWESALIEIDLTEEQKQARKEKRLAIVPNRIGDYRKYVKKVKIEAE
jgi:hypothetical protein|tara:strand:- start:1103 stop:1519 length:417 start_codon:yes stop_codon:yes gene_type:complete